MKKNNSKNINEDNTIVSSCHPYFSLPILTHFTELKSRSPINQGIILLDKSDEINVKVWNDSNITDNKKSCNSRNLK